MKKYSEATEKLIAESIKRARIDNERIDARERIEKARDKTVRLENLIRQEQEKRIS